MESPFVGGGPTELGDRYGAWYRTIIENPETIRDKRLAARVGERERKRGEKKKEKEREREIGRDGLGRSAKREPRP